MSRDLGLPEGITACLFDLDGVLTHTAALHFAAWKQMFDEYLLSRAGASGSEFVSFEMPDYLRYIDGKPRADGVRSFLESRGISLPEGSSADPPAAETIRGLGNRKNELVHQLMREKGVEAFQGSRRYLEAVIRAGLKRAVVSASTNTSAVLEASGLAGRFDTVVDGNVAEREGLRGKPFPDTFLRAAEAVGVPPEAAAVFEDALAGVQAGRAGGFGFVVGVDRANQAEALQNKGADVVVKDLAELLEGQ
ncbi:MAG TPA: beta-phosphoglucomutase family hydrolase [Actinomycetota bacterium]|nr:beta-phosphoglucomutase family hydrolase [Actinomycetota bacterium]